MADGDTPRLDATQLPPSKLTRTKLRWAEQGRFLTGQTRPDGSKRLPPGQHVVRDGPCSISAWSRMYRCTSGDCRSMARSNDP